MSIDFNNLTPEQQKIVSQSQRFIDDLKKTKGEAWATVVHNIAMYSSVMQEFQVRTNGGKVPQWAIDRMTDIFSKTIVNTVNVLGIDSERDKELADDADKLMLIATFSVAEGILEKEH